MDLLVSGPQGWEGHIHESIVVITDGNKVGGEL